MVGAGAVAGTLSGGYTNAARSPDATPAKVAVDQSPAVVRAASASPFRTTQPDTIPSDTTSSNSTTVAMTPIAAASPAPSEPAPASVIAARFPSQWQQQARASTGDNDPPPQAMAYAAEPQRAQSQHVEPAPAAAPSGFALASVDPNPEPAPMPKRIARPEKPKPAVLFNDAQLASIKARLRLTRDQEQHWPQVEQALRAISWKIATQQNARGVVRGKQQAQMIDPNSAEVARLKSAAFPLIMSMREDQKHEVRQLAHTMGLKQVATMF